MTANTQVSVQARIEHTETGHLKEKFTAVNSSAKPRLSREFTAVNSLCRVPSHQRHDHRPTRKLPDSRLSGQRSQISAGGSNVVEPFKHRNNNNRGFFWAHIAFCLIPSGRCDSHHGPDHISN